MSPQAMVARAQTRCSLAVLRTGFLQWLQEPSQVLAARFAGPQALWPILKLSCFCCAVSV
jgi:hypothetical protein